MDWTIWLAMVPVFAFMWWAAFYATKRMRIEKNREREEQARRNIEAAESSTSDKESD